jgi:hypothetical protein
VLAIRARGLGFAQPVPEADRGVASHRIERIELLMQSYVPLCSMRPAEVETGWGGKGEEYLEAVVAWREVETWS